MQLLRYWTNGTNGISIVFAAKEDLSTFPVALVVAAAVVVGEGVAFPISNERIRGRQVLELVEPCHICSADTAWWSLDLLALQRCNCLDCNVASLSLSLCRRCLCRLCCCLCPALTPLTHSPSFREKNKKSKFDCKHLSQKCHGILQHLALSYCP